MSVAVAVLVDVAVAIAILSSWLMLRMRDEVQMLHFIAPPASVSAVLITAAVFVQQGWKSESFKALLIAVILALMNSVVTHATARAFRIRKVRDSWDPVRGEEVPLLPKDEES